MTGSLAEYRPLIIKSMRPRQWIKNFLIFPAMVFAGRFFDFSYFALTSAGFAVFCLLAGSIYLYNDIQDMEKDKEHPTKKLRPIASGQLPVDVAMRAMKIAFVLAWIGAIIIGLISASLHDAVSGKGAFGFFFICVVYFLLHVTYSKWLKHVVIIDVGVIAFGFVLRVMAGGAITGLTISPWIIICTTLLALFLGFGKRRHEIMLLADEATGHRKILEEYSPYFLDQMISVVTASTVVAYSLYTMDADTVAKLGTDKLTWTIPFVLYGIFRYLYLVHQREEGGSPSRILLTDKPLLVDIAAWFATVLLILYVT